jgi:DnaJ-class molecular chaperone
MKHNKIIMDKKKAFKILNLNRSASFEQAKKAYHQLAKKFHPDVSRNQTNSRQNAENTMKEINLAFCYLAPLLKSKHLGSKEEIKAFQGMQKDSEKKKEAPFFSNIFESLSKVFVNKKHNQAFVKNIKKEKSGKNTGHKQSVFDEVLKSVHHSHKVNIKIKSDGIKTDKRYKKNTYNTYQEYMILKKKMNAWRPRANKAMNVGKIEKIVPIQPINPVGRD